MEDLKAKVEKLLSDADDCELIGKLAADAKKRELFTRLAADLRTMARDVEAVIAGRLAEGKKQAPLSKRSAYCTPHLSAMRNVHR